MDPETCDGLFVPLVVWFFVSLAAILAFSVVSGGARQPTCSMRDPRAPAARPARTVPMPAGVAKGAPDTSARKSHAGAPQVRAAPAWIGARRWSCSPPPAPPPTRSRRRQRKSVSQQHEVWEIPLRELRFGVQVGQGAVGAVYLGWWGSRKVAIKKLLGNWLDDKDMVARFREEIELMSSLQHPNGGCACTAPCRQSSSPSSGWPSPVTCSGSAGVAVLMFIGAVLDMDSPMAAGRNICLVTEFCQHGSLRDFLSSPLAMSWRMRLGMALDVARGSECRCRGGERAGSGGAGPRCASAPGEGRRCVSSVCGLPDHFGLFARRTAPQCTTSTAAPASSREI